MINLYKVTHGISVRERTLAATRCRSDDNINIHLN